MRHVWTTGDRISQNIYQVYEQLDLQSCSLEDKLDPKGSAIFSLSTTSSVIKCCEKGLGKKTVHRLCDYVLVIAFQINLYIIFDRKGTHFLYLWLASGTSFIYLELASVLTSVNALSFLRFFFSLFWSFYRFPLPEYASAVKPLPFHIP